ncbi:hypothetical protein LMG29542_08422 [Paraburkholderia humisilvae]|uniref:Uncharacterized protein n=1 Tax=Paraburkholderia humisilvae TaxID=627669 RepID=A0A6J5F875_9BURK|nr:hypothetical protein LMG29542_08422 [Paraburkholderia humisilvae]
MQATGRLFLCARCRAQVFICRRCDRGNRYCDADCAQAARRENTRAAGHRYQQSRSSRFAHAARARRHRVRCKFVTHHRSPASPANDVLQPDPTDAAVAVATDACLAAAPTTSRCHCCGCPLPLFVRTGFVRRRGPRCVYRRTTELLNDDSS